MALNQQRWGTGAGPRVLLIHGVQSSGATWWRIAEGLAQRGADVTAPDLRGHGASPPADRYRLADLVADLRGGWDVVVGHSLGGTLAAFALAHDPAFARRAVLLDPVFDLPEQGFEALVEGQLAELSVTGDELREQHPRWDPKDIRLKLEAARACDPRAAEAVLRDNRPWDHGHLLAHIDTPLTILGADPAHGALFVPIADPSYTMLEGAGHSLHRDDPQTVLHHVNACLQG
jgi:pimeloyl-ACP methyl ester carboxylesterase